MAGADHQGFKTKSTGGGEAGGLVAFGAGNDHFRSPATGTDCTEQADDAGPADDHLVVRADGGTVTNTVLGHREGLSQGGEFKIEPVGDGE